MFQRAMEKGAKVIKKVTEESDEHGTIRYATLQTVISGFLQPFSNSSY